MAGLPCVAQEFVGEGSGFARVVLPVLGSLRHARHCTYVRHPAGDQRTHAERKQALSFAAFMSLNFSMIFMVMALLIAGIVQVYLQRVMGMDFLEVQNHLRIWFEVRLAAGCLFTVGCVLLLWDLFRLATRQPAAAVAVEPAAVPAA